MKNYTFPFELNSWKSIFPFELNALRLKSACHPTHTGMGWCTLVPASKHKTERQIDRCDTENRKTNWLKRFRYMISTKKKYITTLVSWSFDLRKWTNLFLFIKCVSLNPNLLSYKKFKQDFCFYELLLMILNKPKSSILSNMQLSSIMFEILFCLWMT